MAEISHYKASYKVYLDFVQSPPMIPTTIPIATTMPVALELPSSLSQRSYAQALQVKFVSSRVLSPHCECPHYFSSTRDDKINDRGFKFSMACEWLVLIEKDKDDSLQLTNSPKFFPATVLCYTV